MAVVQQNCSFLVMIEHDVRTARAHMAPSRVAGRTNDAEKRRILSKWPVSAGLFHIMPPDGYTWCTLGKAQRARGGTDLPLGMDSCRSQNCF